MLTSSKAQPIHLQLSPDNLNCPNIRQIIQVALDFDVSFIPTLSIFYLMDVRHIHPDFGCLIFDHSGNIYRSQCSSSHISQQLFTHHYGYDYPAWLSYLQSSCDKAVTNFPYQYENQIYVRLPHPHNKHADWFNLSYLAHCRLEIEEDSNTRICFGRQLDFTLKVQQNERLYYDTITFQFTQRSNQLIEQICYGMQIASQWQDYLSEENPGQSYCDFMNNPAFQYFTKTSIPKPFQLAAKLDIPTFLEYSQAKRDSARTQSAKLYKHIESKELIHLIREKLFKYSLWPK